MLKEDESPNYLKNLSKFFFIPYEISFIKFHINLNYIQEKTYLTDHLNDDILKHQKDHIAPSLTILFHNFKDLLPGYHENFTAAFPEVINWSKDGAGLHVVKKLYNHMGNETLLTNEFFHNKVHFWVIEEYPKNTGKELECRTYRPSKHDAL